ncbi:MAG TPA: endolytic transglycosylase MltG [Bryobacteraceae bacterium]|nr:endolytic transglycosylase MltG [Bryobacteraceae bacterium]
MRFIFRLVGIGVVLLVLLAAVAAYFVTRPYKGFDQAVLLEFPKGTGTQAMARELVNAGVLGSDWPFLLVRALQPRSVLQAGEYKFDKAASPWTIYHRIARGDIFYYELLVPEGYNLFDIGHEVEKLGVMKAEQFIAVARDPSMIRDLAPEAPSLEGYLFPASYRLTRRTTPKQLAQEMVNRFRRTWKGIARPGADVHDTVTLASLVEKETGVDSERPQVSSVFQNRLARGMALDCDPTVIYGALLAGRYRGTIYQSDLDDANPYNTYRRAGLPPGPIANPGVASLKAALRPAETDYLFFVAKADASGGHEFSSTLTEHNAHVEAYRRGQKK